MKKNYVLPSILTISCAIAAPIAADLGDQLAKILPNDGVGNAQFAGSIAISGSIAIVGAPRDTTPTDDTGSAYLFDATTGSQTFKLLASDSAAEDHFGFSVALSGANAVIGAPEDDDNGADSGSAYIFDVATGLQSAKFLAADGSAGDEFGVSVAIGSAIAVVGAQSAEDGLGASTGAVYFFDLSTGAQTLKVYAGDADGGDNFGASVSTNGALAIVGAPTNGDNGQQSGSAYIFDVTTGAQNAKLLPSDGAAGDKFGFSVAISGTIAIVGAIGDEDNGVKSGSAYFFDAITGVQLAKILPSDGASGDFFGLSVGIDGSTAILGAFSDDDNGSGSGSAYLFDVTTGAQIAKLLASDGAAGDSFGIAVAISGTTAVVGARDDDDNGAQSGSAYSFDADSPAVPASATVRNGSGQNSILLTSVTRPILGTNWDSDADASGHGASVVSLVIFEQPTSGVFLSSGELLVDLASPLVGNFLMAHSGGTVRFSVAVPLDVSLYGFTGSSQATVFGAPGAELSNALDLVLGF